MSNEAIENAIDVACSKQPRDLTDKEKQYILNCSNGSDGSNPSFWEDLLF